MTDRVEELIAKMDKDGVGSVMAGLRSDNAASNIPIQAALAEYQRRQQVKRDEELRRLAVATLDTQRNGNVTQTKIFRVLVVTLVVTVLVAIFKD